MSTEIISTGGAGLVGTRIQELIPYKFTDLDIATSGVDITKPDQVDEAIRGSQAEVVVHLAAYTNVGGAVEQTGDKNGLCYRLNVEGTRNVAEAAQKHGKHLIAISTDFVLGGRKDVVYDEESPRDPVEWYGQTKAIAEEVVEQVGGSYTIVRIGFPFRANFPSRPDVVRSIQEKLKEGTLPPQFTDHIITPTFIDEIAGALQVVIDTRPEGIFQVVGSPSLSPYELARKVAKISGFNPDDIKEGLLTDYLAKTGRTYPQYLRVSNAKAKQELKVELSDIDTALEKIKKQQSA